MKFGSHDISNFGKPYIIAELGANHNGKTELAKRLVDKAKAAGAHCAKFQSWTKDSIFSKQVYEENRFLNDDYRNRTDFNLEKIVDEYSLSESEMLEMRDYCDKVGIDFASTPFSIREVDFLVDKLDVKFVKVASMDLNNYPFLEYIAKKNKPVILSTGLSSLSEIARAVSTIEKAGNKQIVILHCIANYPPKDENLNLNNIDMLRDNFPQYPVGFSDHTTGTSIPLAAIAKGACLIERHFTLDKEMEGWDHKISADENELAEIVTQSKRVWIALGSYQRKLSEDDFIKIPAFRRSIVAARPIPKGKKITREDLDLKRPGTGIEPQYLDIVIGGIARRDIAYDDMIAREDF